MENKKTITDNKTSSWKDIYYAFRQFGKLYLGFVILAMILTLPTKLIWVVISFLWNLI